MASIIRVAFLTEPCVGVVGRQQATGVVLADKWRGNTRYVYVESAAFKTGARWMSINRVSFVGKG